MNRVLCAYNQAQSSIWHIAVYDHVTHFIGTGFHNCPYCEGRVLAIGSTDERAVLGVCNRCGYWRIVSLEGAGGWKQGQKVNAILATARHYDLNSLDV
jgi:hypothetical protein